jgi:hypothetical protein
VLTGIVVFAYGIGYVNDGSTALNNPRNAQLLVLWGGYFKTYILIGALWIVTGFTSLISGAALWKGREWGRKLGIVSALGTIVGWLVIKITCLHFDVPPPIVVLVLALPMGFLFAGPIRAFCKTNS